MEKRDVIPEWLSEQCDCIVINNHKYYFRCNYVGIERKSSHSSWVNFQMEIVIFSVKDMAFLDHKDVKGTYIGEKISDYLKHTVNGQRSAYWSNKHERNFDKPKLLEEK